MENKIILELDNFSFTINDPCSYSKNQIKNFIDNIDSDTYNFISNGVTSQISKENKKITLYLNDMDHGNEFNYTTQLNEKTKTQLIDFSKILLESC